MGLHLTRSDVALSNNAGAERSNSVANLFQVLSVHDDDTSYYDDYYYYSEEDFGPVEDSDSDDDEDDDDSGYYNDDDYFENEEDEVDEGEEEEEEDPTINSEHDDQSNQDPAAYQYLLASLFNAEIDHDRSALGSIQWDELLEVAARELVEAQLFHLVDATTRSTMPEHQEPLHQQTQEEGQDPTEPSS